MKTSRGTVVRRMAGIGTALCVPPVLGQTAPEAQLAATATLVGGIEAADYPAILPAKILATGNRRNLLFGDTPGWGYYARDDRAISFENISIGHTRPDARTHRRDPKERHSLIVD